MSYEKIKLGEEMRLALNLHDLKTDKFPIARVKDSSNAEIEGSPFSLVHTSNGEYAISVSGLPLGAYRVTYFVYSDLEHTTFIPLYGVAEDKFRIENIENVISGKIQESKAALLSDYESKTTSVKSDISTIEQLSTEIKNISNGSSQKIDSSKIAIESAIADSKTVISGSLESSKTAVRADISTLSTSLSDKTSVINEKIDQIPLIETSDITAIFDDRGLSLNRVSKIDQLDASISSRTSSVKSVELQNQLVTALSEIDSSMRDEIVSRALTVASIVDGVWNASKSDYLTEDSIGQDIQEDITIDYAAIAKAILSQSASLHTDPLTIGGKITATRNNVNTNESKLNDLLTRLTIDRVGKIDRLDATVSSRVSDNDSETRYSEILQKVTEAKTVIDNIISIVGSPENEDLSILALLKDSTFGLSSLKASIDSKASLSEQVKSKQSIDNMASSLGSTDTGLPSILNVATLVYELISSDEIGLSVLKSEIVARPKIINIPTIEEAAKAVWSHLTNIEIAAGSFGEFIKDNLDARISSRSTPGVVAEIKTLTNSIKSTIESEIDGLSIISQKTKEAGSKIDSAIEKIDRNNTSITSSKNSLSTSIEAIENGAPTILSALSEIKGDGFNKASDSLKAIKNSFGSGLATTAKQDEIASKIDTLNLGTQSIVSKINTAISDINTSKTQVSAKIDIVKQVTDSAVEKCIGVIQRLDNSTNGLSQAKAEREEHNNIVEAFFNNLKESANEIELLVNAFKSEVDIEHSRIDTRLNEIKVKVSTSDLSTIIGKLDNENNGLSAIKSEINNLESLSRDSHNSQSESIISMISKIDSIILSMTEIKGDDFNDAKDSLRALKSTLDALSISVGAKPSIDALNAIQTSILEVKGEGFEAGKDSLAVISQKSNTINNISGGGI